MDGRFRIDELNARLRLHLPEDQDYDTIAGFLLARFGRVPDVGETIDYDGTRFTAIHATPTSLKRIGIERRPEPANDGPASNG